MYRRRIIWAAILNPLLIIALLAVQFGLHFRPGGVANRTAIFVSLSLIAGFAAIVVQHAALRVDASMGKAYDNFCWKSDEEMGRLWEERRARTILVKLGMWMDIAGMVL